LKGIPNTTENHFTGKDIAYRREQALKVSKEPKEFLKELYRAVVFNARGVDIAETVCGRSNNGRAAGYFEKSYPENEEHIELAETFGTCDGIVFILRRTSQKASREDRSPGYLQNEILFKCIRCWICIMRRYKDQLGPMVDKRLFVGEFQYCETA
jgi:hypothetical protein